MLFAHSNIVSASCAFILALLIAGTCHASTSNIVIDAESGEILSSQNPDSIHHPASLTKMMTLYITFEAIEKGLIKIDDEFPVSRQAANRSPSKLGVKAGSKLKVRTAIDALIVKSANDCASVLAEGLGYSEAKFAKKMTEVAKALGMKNTVFKNASGLPNSAQVTTARDMALLGAAIYHHFPQYYKLFSKKTFVYQGKTYYTHNHLLKKFPGADGMKTGYIASAGFNIVTSAKRDGRRVIAVTMGHKTLQERDKKVSQLMEKGLQKMALNTTKGASKIYAKATTNNISFDKIAKADTVKNIQKSETNTSETPTIKTASIEPDALWAIQLGAFSNYAKARSYAMKMRREHPELKNKKVNIEPTETASTIVYRSKLVNFTKNSANEICNNLKKSNKSCIVVITNQESPMTIAYK